VKFRRKSAPSAEAAIEPVDGAGSGVPEDATAAGAPAGTDAAGPHDADDVPGAGAEGRIDLGSLLIAPRDGMEVRLQVDEETQAVQAVLLAAEEGALELRAFAAPRGGDLWGEVRPAIAADFAQRGGTATEREGRFGTELVCALTVQMPDGQTGTQPSRIIGVNGPRWMLRATLLGRPAFEDQVAGPWEDVVADVVVRRGGQAMPVGAELPLTLPPRDQLVERPFD
jgi:hypothetical protein